MPNGGIGTPCKRPLMSMCTRFESGYHHSRWRGTPMRTYTRARERDRDRKHERKKKKRKKKSSSRQSHPPRMDGPLFVMSPSLLSGRSTLLGGPQARAMYKRTKEVLPTQSRASPGTGYPPSR